MFSESKEGGASRGLSLKDLAQIRERIDLHLLLRAKSSAPVQTNPKLRNLIELNQRLDILQNRSDLSDGERLRSVIKEFIQPYLGIYIDESKTTLLGGSKKGKTLVFIEDLLKDKVLRKVGPHSNTKAQNLEKDILETFSRSEDTRSEAVDYLFKRAIIDGFGESNAEIYGKAATRAMLMGQEARKRWDQNVDASLQALPEVQRQGLKIGGLQENHDFQKEFWALSGDKEKREKIVASHAAEVFSKLLKGECEKITKTMKDEQSPEKTRILAGAMQHFESLMRDLKKLEANKDQSKLGVEIYAAVLQGYLKIYLHDFEKGSWGAINKGQVLLMMEDLLKQYHLKTGDKRFMGAKADSADSLILSSVMNEKEVDPGTRSEIVAYLFKQVLKGGFDVIANQNEEKADKNRQVFIHGVKALTKMGEEAISYWNEFALNLNQGNSNQLDTALPFTDLIINSQNRSEAEAGLSFEVLANNQEFTAFVNKDVIRTLSDPRAREMFEEKGRGLEFKSKF